MSGRLGGADDGALAKDIELMGRFVEGDDRAFAALYSRHWQPLVAYAFGLCGAIDDAEDAAQDALIKLWGIRTKWKRDTPVGYFLRRVVRNQIGDGRRREQVFARWLRLQRPPRSPPTPEENLRATALLDAIVAARANLPLRRRKVFDYARIRGLPHREIAALMKISVPTVANQMAKALMELRSALRAFMGDSHDAEAEDL